MKHDQDPRLNFQDPATERYYRQRVQQIQDFVTLLQNSSWQATIEWFAHTILSKTGRETAPEPVSLPVSNTILVEVGGKLATSLFDPQSEWPNFSDPATAALCQCVGERLAKSPIKGFADWDAIQTVIADHWPLYEAWLRALDPVDIAACEEQIATLPASEHFTDLFESRYMDLDPRLRNNYMDPLDSLKTLGHGLWQAVDRARVLNQASALSQKVQFRGDLLRRVGVRAWLRWVFRLPFFSMQDIALNELEHIEAVMDVVTMILSPEGSGIKASLAQQVLGVQTVLELLGRIESQLARWSVLRGGDQKDAEALRARVEGDYDRWREEELPAHLTRLAGLIADHGEESLLREILSGIYLYDTSKRNVEGLFRDAVVRATGQKTQRALTFIDHLLADPTNAALLNSALVLFACDVESETFLPWAERIWKAFCLVIEQPEFSWAPNMKSTDDRELAWAMAGLLAHQKNPQNAFCAALEAIHGEPEGWTWNPNTHYDRQRTMVFCLIVGAMASEWMAMFSTPNIEYTRNLYHEVWERSHQWIRFTPDVYDNRLLVQELWPRLSAVYEDADIERYALSGLKDLDELEHIVAACEALANNILGPSKKGPLPSSLQTALQEAFDEQFPVVRASGDLNESAMKWYESTVQTLAQGLRGG